MDAITNKENENVVPFVTQTQWTQEGSPTSLLTQPEKNEDSPPKAIARNNIDHLAMAWPDMTTCSPETGLRYIDYFMANRDAKMGRLSAKALNFEAGKTSANYPSVPKSLLKPSFVSTVLKKTYDGYNVDTSTITAKAPSNLAAKPPSNLAAKPPTPTKPNPKKFRVPKRKKKSVIKYCKFPPPWWNGPPAVKVKVEEENNLEKLQALVNTRMDAEKAEKLEAKKVEARDHAMALQLHMKYLDELKATFKEPSTNNQDAKFENL